MVKINKISFGNNKNTQAKPNKTVAKPKNDSITISNRIKPPVLTNSQIYWNSFTDEQIAQINKSKMLPENAVFVKILRPAWRGTYYFDTGNYSIALYRPWAKYQKGTRILPEGCEVKRTLLKGVMCVPIKKD